MNFIRAALPFAALLLSGAGHATTLNFSSGQYNAANSVYTESGFTVQASHGFHTVHLGTLAWYEGDNTITITSADSAFDLHQLTLVNTAYAGMIFESSKGGSKSIGGISGLVSFSGDEWQSLSYLKIRTITGGDILNQIDNIVLSPVPEPGALTLMGIGVAAMLAVHRKNARGRHSA